MMIQAASVGLARKPKEARAFYLTLALATLVGTGIILLPIDPIRASYWSAVINGVMAAPIIAMMMAMASNQRIMGQFTLPTPLKLLGWLSVGVMGFCVVGLFVTI